jgi:hypothetical protein
MIESPREENPNFPIFPLPSSLCSLPPTRQDGTISARPACSPARTCSDARRSAELAGPRRLRGRGHAMRLLDAGEGLPAIRAAVHLRSLPSPCSIGVASLIATRSPWSPSTTERPPLRQQSTAAAPLRPGRVVRHARREQVQARR